MTSDNGYGSRTAGYIQLLLLFERRGRAGRARPGCARGTHPKVEGPTILAGDFNAKARAWTGGLRDPRGDVLEEMMGAHNLVVGKPTWRAHLREGNC